MASDCPSGIYWRYLLRVFYRGDCLPTGSGKADEGTQMDNDLIEYLTVAAAHMQCAL